MAFKTIEQIHLEQFEQVTKAVLKYYGLRWSQINIKSRLKRFVRARQVIIYLSRKHIDRVTYQFLSERFNNNIERSTVNRITKTLEGWIETDKAFAAEIKQIEDRLFKELPEIPVSCGGIIIK